MCILLLYDLGRELHWTMFPEQVSWKRAHQLIMIFRNLDSSFFFPVIIFLSYEIEINIKFPYNKNKKLYIIKFN